MANNFCAAPFIHRFISTQGKKFLCCGSDRWPKPGVSNEYQEKLLDLEDWEGEDYQKVRDFMLNGDGWLEECRTCKNAEALGDNSLRKWMNTVWKESGSPTVDIQQGTVFGAPFFYDLRFSNVCNLACRMCSPESSSQLVKEAELIPELYPHWEKYDKEFKLSLGRNKNIDKLLEEAKFIKYITFLGGEPTLQPEVKQLLRKFIEVGNTSVTIKVTTNGTNAQDEFYKLLTKFDMVYLNVSFDSHPDRLEYIRGNANGKKIWKNIQKFSQMSWNGELFLEVSQAVMNYNIFDFWELGQLVDETPWVTRINTYLVAEPFQHCAGYIKQKWKEKAIDIAKHNNSYDKHKHIFDDMLSKETNLEHVKRLKYLTEIQDFSRNKYLKDYHPICHEMLEDIE
jgi:sulfatase maturation enzyme AslB (radical SAM superfamily)